jgi:hypothetical protein
VTVSTRPQTPSLPREPVLTYVVTLAAAAALWGAVIAAWTDPRWDAGWAILFALGFAVALVSLIAVHHHEATR